MTLAGSIVRTLTTSAGLLTRGQTSERVSRRQDCYVVVGAEVNPRTWKRAESEAAVIIGGRRVWQRFSAGDAESAAFVADAKKRRVYSQRQMRDDLDKLQRNPETRGRTAVLVLIDTPGRGHKARAPLVVMTAEAFQAWHGSKGSAETMG